MQLIGKIESLDKALNQNMLKGADDVFEFQGLVEVKAIDSTIEVELIYATEQNFIKQILHYRPNSVQRIMYDLVPNGVYVADPNVGSDHNRGAAVVVTIADENGEELVMPTGIDDFTEKALRSYPDMDEEARKNMFYLTDVMGWHGFTPIRSEWWHFNDSDVKEYPHLDICFEDWVNEYFSRK